MDEKHRDEFRALLRQYRESVLDSRRRSDEDMGEIARARSAATADDEHDPEGATLSDEWARLAGMDAEAERELVEIDEAIARIDGDAYGVCSGCGGRIPLARLRIRPTATMCVDCASRV